MPLTLTQKVNDFALRSFRDTADKDYIHARMAYRAELFPQFHWSALHALEKYAKCIAILTRTPKPKKAIKHEIQRSLDLVSDKIDINLSEPTQKFINQLEQFGARFRYLEISWSIHECELPMLDRAVWELRRYCNANLYNYKENQFISTNPEILESIKEIKLPTKENTIVTGGYIEKVLENRLSSTRPYLVWCNLFYSASNRKSVFTKRMFMGENAPFFLHPEIIDEVSKYTFVADEIRRAYNE